MSSGMDSGTVGGKCPDAQTENSVFRHLRPFVSLLSSMPPPLLAVTHRRGIHLPEADLWLDPHFGVDRAFISHAHADHVARHERDAKRRVDLCCDR